MFFQILNRDRSAKKGIVVEGMEDLFNKGRTRFGYPESQVLSIKQMIHINNHSE